MSKKYHHGDLRAALIEKTLAMVQDDQVHRIGFRELARELDVSRSAPYRHFESVEALLATVVEGGFNSFVDALQVVTDNKELSSKEKFLELGIVYVNFAVENSSHYRLMFDQKFYQKDGFPEITRLARKSFDILRQTASSCLLPNSTKEEELNLATLAWACVHGLSKLFIDGQLPHIEDRAKFVRLSCQKLLQLV